MYMYIPAGRLCFFGNSKRLSIRQVHVSKEHKGLGELVANTI